jgi:pyruvate/2-oxoglutarate dehydrogenase complex dihydrolipoamide dehydrogenase (E3) component
MGIGVLVSSARGEETLDASHILVTEARRPNLDGLELERAKIRRSSVGLQLLQLSSGLRTSNRRVYAIGDAAGGPPSSHFASHQAAQVVRHALLGVPMRRGASLPSVTYTDPEIAEVGLTEAAARARLKDGFRVLRCAFADNDRARALRQTFGLAKLITDPRGRILGAGVVGPGAGELIALFGLAIANGLSARHLQGFVAPHPTLSEIAGRLGAEFDREQAPHPLQERLLAVVRLIP